MTSRTVGAVQLALAALAAVGCVLSWVSARSLEVVAPILDGEPTRASLVYDPSLITLSLFLAAAAGMAAVAGFARLRRG